MKFSIITACKNRLSHLKESLPAMLVQPDSEVIVVDFSCGEGTAEYVRTYHPQARVVEVPGKDYFSNWEARNAGAAAAAGEWLVFVDADVILNKDCISWLDENMKPGIYAKFKPGKQLERHKSNTSAISLNNLQGFLVIRRPAFDRVGGYDDLLRGWGAGGDVDIQNALAFARIKKTFLPEHIVDRIIEHGDDLRFAHTGGSFRRSFIQNLLYRELKRFLMPILGLPIPLETRKKVYAATVKAATSARGRSTSARADVILSRRAVEMRRRLGHPKAEIQISLRALVDNLEIPQQPARPAAGAQPAAPAPEKAEQLPT
jgi:glycosyltransferase involved in cell wall biosynthesis